MPESPEELFAQVHREHLGLVIKTAHAFAPEPGDRDDLRQEILLALWQALPRFKAEAKLSTYVYRVALSCALNWKRSRRRYRMKIDLYANEAAVDTYAPPPTEQPRLQWLYTRIHQLPPVDRTLILLSLEKVGYGEIAEITGLTESNIGVRLHRIKQQLVAQSEEIKNEI